MVINEKIGSRQLHIKLQPGFYSTCGDGGEGKTYIRKLLEYLVNMGDKDIKVLKSEDDLAKSLDDLSNYKFIYADRADLYYTESLDQKLVDVSKNVPVFVDLKNWELLTVKLPTVVGIIIKEGSVAMVETNDIRR